MHTTRQRGFSAVEAVVILVILGLIGFVGWWVFARQADKKEASSQSQPESSAGFEETADSSVRWSFNGTEWKATATPPACPDPLEVPSPVDISKASAILYPGQVRGGNYKPHGGFRFDSLTNDAVTVTAPLSAVVTQGSRYIEQGEVQYLFEFVHPCGIMYRFDHLLVLSPAMQALAEKLPAAKVDDSRTTPFEDAPKVKAGDELATAVGFRQTQNVGVDFGMYDLRRKNKASEDAGWMQAQGNNSSLSAYAICWLDSLAGSAKATAKALPGGDAQAGKQSDYCD